MSSVLPDSAYEETGLHLVRICRTPDQAHDLGLILLSAGLAYWVVPHEETFALLVETPAVEEIRQLLDRDDRIRAVPTYLPPVHFASRLGSLALFWGLIAGITILAWNATTDLTGLGGLQADRVLFEGEWWRIITALTLHADIAHLISNLVAGMAITFALGQWTGTGNALLITLGSGALGNLLTLLLRTSSPILSLGASTAVFGALGALSAMPGILQGRRRWLPLATGVVILGLYGAGEARTDVLAHVCGFIAGWGIGRLRILLNRRVPLKTVHESTRLFLVCLCPILAWLWALRAGVV